MLVFSPVFDGFSLLSHIVAGLREERLKLEVKGASKSLLFWGRRGLERALEEKDGLEEALSEARRRLETPEYVLHAELKQAYADLRDGWLKRDV